MKWILFLLAPLALLAALTSCGSGRSARTVTIKGSDTLLILGQRWAEMYMHHNPGVTVQVTGGGSGTGIAALTNGGTDICAASRPMIEKEEAEIKTRRGGDVKEIPIALDGLAIFLNDDNPVKQLTMEQLNGIYRHKITDWNEVGGAPGKIVCYGRDNSSGTHMYFQEHVLKNQNFADEVQPLPGTAAVINAVLKDKSGIGYGGIGYSKGVKAIPVSAKSGDAAIEPTMDHVVSGTYPLSRKLFFYTVGAPTGETKAFIDWTLSSEGQRICAEVGYFPIQQQAK